MVLGERCAEGYSEPPALALGGPSVRDRETVRKLSPYDVFPPSQRRFRRDIRGAKRAAFSVGVMENRRNRKRWRGREREIEKPTPREKKDSK